jgi:hypothetical protein
MACALTQGYVAGCRDSNGGIKKFYIAEWTSAWAYTIASGAVTVSTSGAPTFRSYEQEVESGMFEESIQTNRQNGTLFYEQDITMILLKMQATLRNEIYLVAQNKLFVIARDENDKYWLIGRQRGAMLDPSKAGTGTARGDRNGYELKFKGKEALPAEEISATVVTALALT